MRLVLLVPLAAAVLPSGCYLAHERGGGAGDASIDAWRTDTGPRRPDADANLPDADAAACERVDGFRRCDDACPLPCSGEDGRCSIGAQVCRGSILEQGDGCFHSGAFTQYCTGAWLCATNTQRPTLDAGLETEAFHGACMPSSFCTDAPRAGMAVACVYSDGTPFVTGPPPGACPTSSGATNCGGVCGDALCVGICLGVSDDRRYGLCVDTPVACWEEDATMAHNRLQLANCETRTGASCACLVPSPQRLDPTGVHERGWPVPTEACEAYASENPGHARCVDGDWNPV